MTVQPAPHDLATPCPAQALSLHQVASLGITDEELFLENE